MEKDEIFTFDYIETIMKDELQGNHCNVEDYMEAVLINIKKG